MFSSTQSDVFIFILLFLFSSFFFHLLSSCSVSFHIRLALHPLEVPAMSIGHEEHLAQKKAAEWVPLWLSVLRICCCYSCGCGQKKKKERKKATEYYLSIPILTRSQGCVLFWSRSGSCYYHLDHLRAHSSFKTMSTLLWKCWQALLLPTRQLAIFSSLLTMWSRI